MDLSIERFIVVFKQYVQRSPVYYADQEPETCIGCLQAPADVKINRRCISPPPHFKFGPKPCQQCNCRVLWCASCMARWWASRQDGPAELWLSGRATCPMCRAPFCLLDVSPARLKRNKLSSFREDEVQHPGLVTTPCHACGTPNRSQCRSCLFDDSSPSSNTMWGGILSTMPIRNQRRASVACGSRQTCKSTDDISRFRHTSRADRRHAMCWQHQCSPDDLDRGDICQRQLNPT